MIPEAPGGPVTPKAAATHILSEDGMIPKIKEDALMTELEKMQRAKMYLDKLANGFDPITDVEMPEDSDLNNIRLSRCFFYVSDVLRQVIENGGEITPKKTPRAPRAPKRPEFYLPPEKLLEFPFSAMPLTVSELTTRLNQLIEDETMKKITVSVITGWLLNKGFLEVQESLDGRRNRLPTKQGEDIGLSTDIRVGQYGEFRTVLYHEAAQRFIIDNLDVMLEAHRNRDKNKDKDNDAT